MANDLPSLMRHENLLKRINAMHEQAVLAHRTRFENADGSYDELKFEHHMDQIKQMAQSIYLSETY